MPPIDIPEDIMVMMEKNFPLASDRSEVESFIQSLWSVALNVGAAQLARAILHLAGGDLEEVRKIRNTRFYGDPRDVIMLAKSLPGNKDDSFFIDPAKFQ